VSLAEVQKLFWRSVRFDPAPPEVDVAFLSHGTLSGRERMAIYRNMYWYRQVDALWDTFGVLASLMGERDFTQMVCRYITSHPSEKPALEWLGRNMEGYLRSEGAEALQVDVAAFEWAHLEAIVAPNPVRRAALSDIQAERFAEARLVFDPSARLVHVDPVVLELWDRYAFSTRREIEPLAKSEYGAESERAPFVVWRPGHASRHLQLTQVEANALQLALSGANMEAVCASFLPESAEDEHAAQATQVAFAAIRGWFEMSWIGEVQ
jgi:hypothetical protein